MPKKIEERLNILSPYRGFIAPINMMGPIVHPLPVDKSKVAKIIASGAKVYEFIPKTKETIELTLSNLNNLDRYNSVKAQEEVKAETKPEPIPVEPITKVGVPKIETPAEVIEETPVEEIVTEEVTEEASTEETIEESIVEEETAEKDNELITFQYNEDGTVDESVIDWSKYTKNERKSIRTLINEHNSSIPVNE